MSDVIARLIGVYDADGSMVGELSYLLRARIGLAHCALCDITHGRLRERADWRACRERLPVPVVMFHRDDQPEGVRNAVGALAPVLVAETVAGALVVLADREQLELCEGSPARLRGHIESAVLAHGLSWPTGAN